MVASCMSNTACNAQVLQRFVLSWFVSSSIPLDTLLCSAASIQCNKELMWFSSETALQRKCRWVRYTGKRTIFEDFMSKRHEMLSATFFFVMKKTILAPIWCIQCCDGHSSLKTSWAIWSDVHLPTSTYFFCLQRRNEWYELWVDEESENDNIYIYIYTIGPQT